MGLVGLGPCAAALLLVVAPCAAMRTDLQARPDPEHSGEPPLIAVVSGTSRGSSFAGGNQMPGDEPTSRLDWWRHGAPHAELEVPASSMEPMAQWEGPSCPKGLRETLAEPRRFLMVAMGPTNLRAAGSGSGLHHGGVELSVLSCSVEDPEDCRESSGLSAWLSEQVRTRRHGTANHTRMVLCDLASKTSGPARKEVAARQPQGPVARPAAPLTSSALEAGSEWLHLHYDDDFSVEDGAISGTMTVRSHGTVAQPSNEKELCAVCFGDVMKPETLRCSHSFCKGCIDDWLRIADTCPTCRQVARPMRLAARRVAGSVRSRVGVAMSATIDGAIETFPLLTLGIILESSVLVMGLFAYGLDVGVRSVTASFQDLSLLIASTVIDAAGSCK